MSDPTDVTTASDTVEPARTGTALDGREPLTLINVRQGTFGARGDTSGYDGLVRRIEMPGATDRPYGEWFDGVVDILEELLGRARRGGDPIRGRRPSRTDALHRARAPP